MSSYSVTLTPADNSHPPQTIAGVTDHRYEGHGNDQVLVLTVPAVVDGHLTDDDIGEQRYPLTGYSIQIDGVPITAAESTNTTS